MTRGGRRKGTHTLTKLAIVGLVRRLIPEMRRSGKVERERKSIREETDPNEFNMKGVGGQGKERGSNQSVTCGILNRKPRLWNESGSWPRPLFKRVVQQFLLTNSRTMSHI